MKAVKEMLRTLLGRTETRVEEPSQRELIAQELSERQYAAARRVWVLEQEVLQGLPERESKYDDKPPVRS